MMLNIFNRTAGVFIIFLTANCFCSSSDASPFKCSVEFHHESAKAKKAALNCGEFIFDSNIHEQKRQVFENCQNVTVAVQPNPTPNGTEILVEMSAPLDGKMMATGLHGGAVYFAAKTLPSEFHLERSASRREEKHVLDDTHILVCRQLSDKSAL